MQTNSLPKRETAFRGYSIAFTGDSAGLVKNRLVQNRSRKRTLARGFSLIEVILALGVVAFAFVALFGMLPVGLNAFNNSVDSTISAQIAENVMSQLRQGKFSQISTQYNDITDTAASKFPSFYAVSGTTTYPAPAIGFYFDDQGNQISFVNPTATSGTTNVNAVATVPNNYVYSAEVQVYYNSGIPLTYQPSQIVSGTASGQYNFVGTGTFIASPTNSGTSLPQQLATVVITVRKISTPRVAKVYTGYIDNNGL